MVYYSVTDSKYHGHSYPTVMRLPKVKESLLEGKASFLGDKPVPQKKNGN